MGLRFSNVFLRRPFEVKPVGHLIEAIADLDNLKLAFVKSCRAKPLTLDRLDFRGDVEANLRSIGDALLSGSYAPGPYRFFTIIDPKERRISAAPFRDRVTQHAIMNILDPLFERVQIHHSYACRKGKGTKLAVLTAFHHCKSQAWFLKLDVRKYFDSISHEILKKQIRRLVSDSLVLAALFAIIDSYETTPGRGLPIGNLTSQYFANHYLSGYDHVALEKLRIGRYIRYMDDMALWAEEKECLVAAEKVLRSYAECELGLVLKVPILNRVAAGVPFCGFLIKSRGIFLMDKTRRRYRRTQHALMAGLAQGTLDQQGYADRALASASHLAIARSRRFRYAVFRQGFYGVEPRETGWQLEQ
jgi:hypothetical protein